MSVVSCYFACVMLFKCLFVYRPFYHGALKPTLATLFAKIVFFNLYYL